MEMKRIDNLFMSFAAIYGYRWASIYSATEALGLAKQEWGDVINRMRDEDILNGIRICKLVYDWPPSLAKFIKIALAIDEQALRRECFPKGTGMLTYKQVEDKLEKERPRLMCALVEQRLEPERPKLEVVE